MTTFKNIFSYIKIGFEFFCKWKFRFSFIKILLLYIAVISIFVTGWQFYVNGHGIGENTNVNDWRVEYGGLDWPTVVIIAFVTLFFITVLFYRNKEEIRKFYMKEYNRASFDEIYVPYFKKLFLYFDLDNYKYWAHNFCVAGDCRITEDRYYNLRKLVDFCDQIQKIEGYESYYNLTLNLKMVLKDTLNVFDIHSKLIGGGEYDFHKFYNDHLYDERSEREEFEWQEEVLLISDLFFEFTCMANLLLRKIRELNPSFLSEYGNLTIVDAKDSNNRWSSIEFNEDEVSESPYPGLQEFLTLRLSRHFHYKSNGDKIKDALHRELVL